MQALQAGTSYVIFGKSGIAQNGVFALSSLNGNNGFKINGVNGVGDSIVSGIGDVNNDQIDDIAIVADSSQVQGNCYVIFGSAEIASFGSFDLSSVNGTNGFQINCPGSYTRPLSSAGDVNADGISDFIIGSSNGFQFTSDALSVSDAGDINSDGIDDLILGPDYVVFGSKILGSTGFFDLSKLDGINGFTFSNVVPGSESSGIAKYAGDFNGDGISDVIIGPGDIVFGRQGIASSGEFDLLRSLNGTNGLRYDTGSNCLSDAGDVNDDGVSDVIIGNRWESWGGRFGAGGAYVLFGDATPQLIANELTIVEGQTVILNSSNLNATRAKRNNPDLLFIVSNVTHGYFSISGNLVVTSFTQKQIWNSNVKFTHDDSDFPPAYLVSVSSVSSSFSLSSEEYLGNVNFIRVNKPPKLINNTLSINQGQARTLTSGNLSAMDPDTPSPDLLFIANNIQHGKFINVMDTSKSAITRFFQQNVSSARIQFIHDGSEQPPSYDVIVTDGSLSDLPQSSVIYFHRIPVLINNQLVINMGEEVVLAPSNLPIFRKKILISQK